jgi:hypothetical protein
MSAEGETIFIFKKSEEPQTLQVAEIRVIDSIEEAYIEATADTVPAC